jgi:hypothetical protein
MINTEDQEQLFKLISEYIKKDIICIAIGGTAMMFQGYKSLTKDIDLVFMTNEDRDIFIDAIKELGYSEKSLLNIYDSKREKNPFRPLIYSRGEERFDLFVKNVFGFNLEFNQDKIVQRHDFIGKCELILYILPKELLILLKSITNREKDFEDIETIIKIEKNIDWEYIVSVAKNQKDCNEWILIDLEETLQKVKKFTFIKKKVFDMVYE